MADADYTGRDQRLKYLFQNGGGGGGGTCLYDAEAISGIASNLAVANANINEILQAIGGGGGSGGGSEWSELTISEIMRASSRWTITEVNE